MLITITAQKVSDTAKRFTFLVENELFSKMTKLMQWLFFGFLFLSFWVSLITKKINHSIVEDHPTVILFLPAILIILFGVYGASVVLWRVYTFNDCKDAALELRKQINEAKADLKAKGFHFK